MTDTEPRAGKEPRTVTVRSSEDLVGAAADPEVRCIEVSGTVTGAPSFRLAPGQRLAGVGPGAAIEFAPGVDGVQLSADNDVRGLRLLASPDRRAIFNDHAVAHLGILAISGVAVTGQVQILARHRVQRGHVAVAGLDVVAADARSRLERPHAFGLDVLQGAFTLYNVQTSPASLITADLTGISAGRDGAPVLGSGVLVGGGGEDGGRVQVTRLHTGAVISTGTLPEGTATVITAGVFVLHGAHVDEVVNGGPVTTLGVNDMVLDNWGDVRRWTAQEAITSHGPSGIGFVNFGSLGELRILRLLETHGPGARAFNACGGDMGTVEIGRIVTHAAAGVGVQVSRPIGRLVVHEGIETRGGPGPSLVKGVIRQLSAYGISILPGGRIGEAFIDGGITTRGPGVPAVRVEGHLGSLTVHGGVRATGRGADAIVVVDGAAGLRALEAVSLDAAAIRLENAFLTAVQALKASGAEGGVVVGSDSIVATPAASVDELARIQGNAFQVSGPGVLRTCPVGS
jgi:hypothetical protein